MHTLERYVGRSIRLHEPAYRDLVRQSKLDEDVLENYFLVAAVSTGLRKLICYGADQRILVGLAEVVLV